MTRSLVTARRQSGRLREADKHAKETLRLWDAGEQWFPSPREEVNLAAAYLRLREEARISKATDE